jgi:hypothetical protein
MVRDRAIRVLVLTRHTKLTCNIHGQEVHSHNVPNHPVWPAVRPSAKVGWASCLRVVRWPGVPHKLCLGNALRYRARCRPGLEINLSASFLAHIQFCLSFCSNCLTYSLPSLSVWLVRRFHCHHRYTAADCRYLGELCCPGLR